jgi:hypothetical protein
MGPLEVGNDLCSGIVIAGIDASANYRATCASSACQSTV